MAVRQKGGIVSPAIRQAVALERIADSLEALGELRELAKVASTHFAGAGAVEALRDAALAAVQEAAAASDPLGPRRRDELEAFAARQAETLDILNAAVPPVPSVAPGQELDNGRDGEA